MKKKQLFKLLLREQQRADLLGRNLKKMREKLGRVSELRNRLEKKLKELGDPDVF